MEVEDKILRLANKFGMEIPKDLVFGEVEELDLRKGEEIVYKYEGPPAQRRFCREMLRLNKFYTKEEIDIMSFQGKNKQFAHKGSNYSIWKYKGGPFCRHSFMAYTVIRDKNNKIIQIVKIGKAPGEAGEVANSSNNFWAHPSGRFAN